MLKDVQLKPRNGEKIERAVIILHGLGDNARGIMGLGEAMHQALPGTLFVAPDAPGKCEYVPGGYQWFSPNDWTPSVVYEGIKASATALNEYIDHVMESFELPAARIALLGFSQGTMMSLHVGPRREEQLAGILGYSGALVEGAYLLKEKKSSPPVCLIHGQVDDVVPFGAMERARLDLLDAKIQVETLACPGLAHGVDNAGLLKGVSFLRNCFGLEKL